MRPWLQRIMCVCSVVFLAACDSRTYTHSCATRGVCVSVCDRNVSHLRCHWRRCRRRRVRTLHSVLQEYLPNVTRITLLTGCRHRCCWGVKTRVSQLLAQPSPRRMHILHVGYEMNTHTRTQMHTHTHTRRARSGVLCRPSRCQPVP